MITSSVSGIPTCTGGELQPGQVNLHLVLGIRYCTCHSSTDVDVRGDDSIGRCNDKFRKRG